MPSPEYSAGFIGIVTAGGIDWNISEWSATGTTEWAETTNTGNYDPVTGRCWNSSIPTTCGYSGSFTFFFDKNNNPYGVIDHGKTVAINMTAAVGKNLSGPVGIDSLEFRQGGVKGVMGLTCNWHSVGAMTNPA